MQYTMYPEPIIYFALLLINIAVIFVFYLAMQEFKKGKQSKRRRIQQLNTPNSWWAILMVMVLALIASLQNNIQAWSMLLIIPMVNLALAAMIEVMNHRFSQLRAMGFHRA